jgi:hypothetical protein
MAVTPREQQIVDLHENGLDPVSIADTLGLNEGYMRRRISYLSIHDHDLPRHRMMMARGSAALLLALRSAGLAPQ